MSSDKERAYTGEKDGKSIVKLIFNDNRKRGWFF